MLVMDLRVETSRLSAIVIAIKKREKETIGRGRRKTRVLTHIKDEAKYRASIQRFDWLREVLPSSDIDFVYERNGFFLIIESKDWKKGVGFIISRKHYWMLKKIAKYPNFVVLLMQRDPHHKLIYYLNIRKAEPIEMRSYYRIQEREMKRITEKGFIDSLKAWFAHVDGFVESSEFMSEVYF